MKHRILLIDDEAIQVENIRKVILRERPSLFVDSATTEEAINEKVSNTYFNIALVDLRMDAFSINGFSIIRDIIEINPFCKIIISSAYIAEYSSELNDIIKTGKVAAILDKEKFDKYKTNLLREIDDIINDFELNLQINRQSLQYLYAEVKDIPDAQIKGKRFEYFVSTLFSQMGFNHINTRMRDKSLNEVDLMIRNDVRDLFFQKFKPYFLVECKNTIDFVDKNQFVIFLQKLENTNGLANLGFIITASGFKRNTYIEAVRSSSGNKKIVFISNSEIGHLIQSDDMLDGLKQIIDSQVKDNWWKKTSPGKSRPILNCDLSTDGCLNLKN